MARTPTTMVTQIVHRTTMTVMALLTKTRMVGTPTAMECQMVGKLRTDSMPRALPTQMVQTETLTVTV